MFVKGWLVSKYLPDPGLLLVLHLFNSPSYCLISFHKSTLKRSLDIDDLPHGPLLNLIVSIKLYYDSIAQWTKTCNYLSSWPKLVLFACNFSPLKLFAFRTFPSNNNHAQPSKKKVKPLAFITSLISLPKTSKINPSLNLLERSLSRIRRARS